MLSTRGDHRRWPPAGICLLAEAEKGCNALVTVERRKSSKQTTGSQLGLLAFGGSLADAGPTNLRLENVYVAGGC
eukprot:gene25244-biopygen5989